MTAGDTSRFSLIASLVRRPAVVASLAALVLLAWAASGVYTVAPDQRGVVLRFGRVVATQQPGIHYALPWPIERAHTPSTTELKRLEVGFKMLGRLFTEGRRADTLTGDENILRVMMVVQYKIKDPEAYLFGVEQPDWLVERAVECAISRRIGSLAVDDVLTTAKARIQIDVIAAAQHWLDDYGSGIVLLGGNLQRVRPPQPVQAAFNEVTDAKKDSERAIDEARGYQGRVIPQARGEAQRIVSRAEGFYASRVNRARGEASRFLSLLAEYRKATDVTRTRLFVETMQRLFARAKTVILDTDHTSGPTKITIVSE